MESKDRREPQTDKTHAAKSLDRSIFLDNDIWHCILSVYCFYGGLWIDSQAASHGSHQGSQPEG